MRSLNELASLPRAVCPGVIIASQPLAGKPGCRQTRTEDAVTLAPTYQNTPADGRPLPRADQEFVTELAVALHKHTI